MLKLLFFNIRVIKTNFMKQLNLIPKNLKSCLKKWTLMFSGFVPDFDHGRGHVVPRYDQRVDRPQEHCNLHERQDRHRHRPQAEHDQERGPGKYVGCRS